ncbi:transglutaminase family protein [Burkholderiaceae bacterium FT117]|uniref:transglutaminase-like domain-containing protein n=1 Tax=Zeimonas sediminis TaxID=2944268 RepID=UPI002342CBE2|nr:transglutaminase family protein [Zeimonas sediminis]MCM5570270.1 transglutaminase family protein [Zeimonas sediminis]
MNEANARPDFRLSADGGIHLPGLPEALAGDALRPWLAPTRFLDSGSPAIREFVAQAIGGESSERARAVRLFYAVRDRIRYDPYRISFDPCQYRASGVLAAGCGWCVPKAVLLAACARAAGIASAIGLADVVNHMNTEKLRQRMGGTDVFYDHGYAALLVEGRWLKAVPAFNIELCERFGVRPTEFDGTADALYQEFDADNRRRMAYLADHGTWSDFPLDKVRGDFARHYPRELFEGESSPVPGRESSGSATGAGRFEDDAPLR